jgi:hypothetical protein
MAEPCLQRPRIVPGVRQGEAARVPQHVAMDRECQTSTRAYTFDETVDGVLVNGPPRSVANTKPLSGNCRRSSRNALISSPRSGWTLGLPFFLAGGAGAAERGSSVGGPIARRRGGWR